MAHTQCACDHRDISVRDGALVLISLLIERPLYSSRLPAPDWFAPRLALFLGCALYISCGVLIKYLILRVLHYWLSVFLNLLSAGAYMPAPFIGLLRCEPGRGRPVWHTAGDVLGI